MVMKEWGRGNIEEHLSSSSMYISSEQALVIPIDSNKRFGLVDKPERVGGEHNTKNGVENVECHHPHHPWIFFPWRQYSMELSLYLINHYFLKRYRGVEV
jgi:hypothetical protein